MLLDMESYGYEERLDKLNLISLESTNLRGDDIKGY